MWFAEHPGRGVAARKALLWVLIFYGGGFVFLRLTDDLPPRPDILKSDSPDTLASRLFLPCYLMENFAAKLTGHP